MGEFLKTLHGKLALPAGAQRMARMGDNQFVPLRIFDD
jgi:hypothetical protein